MATRILKILIYLVLCFSLVFSVSGALTDGLLHYWSFDDSVTNATHTQDLVTGDYAKIYNAHTGKTGVLNQDFHFDGADDYINQTLTNKMNSTYHSFSYWFNSTSTNRDFHFDIRTRDSTYSARLEMNYDGSDGEIFFPERAGGTSDDSNLHLNDANDYTDGAFYHIVVTRRGKDAKHLDIWINGVNTSWTIIADEGGQSNNINYQMITIGKFTLNNNYDTTGNIDEFGVWNRSLTPSEIGELYNGGVGLNPLAPTDTIFIYPRTLNTTCSGYNFTNGLTLTYCDSPYNFTYIIKPQASVSVVNVTYALKCDLNTTWNHTYNVSNLTFSISQNLVRDFPNPFNMTDCDMMVSALSNLSHRFNNTVDFVVHDYIKPVCNGFANFSGYVNSSSKHNITCTDEILYSFNLSCSDGVNYYQNNILAQEFNYSQNHTHSANATCFWKICDGHTTEKLENFEVLKDIDKKRYIIEGNILKYSDDLILSKETDRYTFTDKKAEGDKSNKYEYFYTSRNGVYIPDSHYKGWIVDDHAELWLDFNGEGEVIVNKHNSTTFKITVTTPSKEVKFNSIGALNCINATTTITAIPIPAAPGSTTVNVNINLDSNIGNFNLTDVIFIGMLIALWVVLIILTETLQGRSGDTIQLFNLFQVAVGVYLSLYFIEDILLLGLSFSMVSAGYFIYKAM